MHLSFSVPKSTMSEQRDYGLSAATAFLAVVVPVGSALIIHRTVLNAFPEITLGGWLLVCGYLLTTVAVPTAITPVLSRAIDVHHFPLWRVTACLWVTITAIVGLLLWPAIGTYIQPFFVGAGRPI